MEILHFAPLIQNDDVAVCLMAEKYSGTVKSMSKKEQGETVADPISNELSALAGGSGLPPEALSI